MPTGATPTMSTAHTVLSATNHQRSSPRPSVSRNSCSDWTDFRGPHSGPHAIVGDQPQPASQAHPGERLDLQSLRGIGMAEGAIHPEHLTMHHYCGVRSIPSGPLV